jgi:hypothetical protein
MWCRSPEDEVFHRCADVHEAWKAGARKRREVVEHEKRIVVHMDLKLSNSVPERDQDRRLVSSRERG